MEVQMFTSTSSAPTRKEGRGGNVSMRLMAEGVGRGEGRRGWYKIQPKTCFTHRQNKLLYKALQLTWLLLKENHDTARHW